MNVLVFYHDKCFDGACSASLFARFHRECIGGGESRYGFHGLVHRAGALFRDDDFTGDENAIVDFKYSSSPRVTWWFDHHLSAFLTAEDHERFLHVQAGSGRDRLFYDPDYTSCTSFIAHIAETRFGFNPAPVAELVRWADIVDGALYESPETAVAMAEPAMKLTLAIESTQDPGFIPRLIPLLTTMSLQQILQQPFVRDLLDPLLERHRQLLALIRERAQSIEGTIYFDITGYPFEGYNKFIPYFLHQEAVYSVGLSRSSFRTKVAVGTNPWTKTRPEDLLNLASICERYGGGGHARVGAISFPPEEDAAARAAAHAIVAELRAHNPKS